MLYEYRLDELSSISFINTVKGDATTTIYCNCFDCHAFSSRI